MWGIELQKRNKISLARQIFLSLKQSILMGQISQGEVLPSTRELAKGLGVSRNTVCDAYDMLLTEGFIVSRQGAPSHVAEGLHITQKEVVSPKEHKRERPPIRWDFKTGQPDLSLFPWPLWSQMIRRATNTLSAQQLEYSGPKGYEPLCEEIAHWLMRSRSMDVNPEDIFITSGATQAFHLLVDILHKEGHAFALESPSHPGIRTVIQDRGHLLQWMPVDQQGADISCIRDKDISTVYVTPSHQFPLGGIFPATRRAALIRLASEKDFYIIEDDYDSEFRYSGAPVSPIYSMDSSRVVYVGTFSKTLFPSLRIGFTVLPKPLQAKWKHYRNFMDVQNPVLEQVALTEFLRKRKMDKHIQHMRRVYAEKRNVLLNAIEHSFSNAVQFWGDASGLHVALQFPGMEFGKQFMLNCRNAGIRIQPVSQYCSVQDNHKDKLLTGYGHLSDTQIREGVQALFELIAKNSSGSLEFK
ncbi:PLP-dependent aminotransferase family protein [Clostridium formicaceticum]|uniref:GntR family transcriptional regulator n=1 Tax=Clostridium formicaceticum TaxID=1497 RepID=A0AAC9RQI2_9CLOT|nr:PLP-dependent aminotransferase family protein [Clostridium formicaceticum]AOY75319.1 GntR family transcriptional regulator [Clostridium formicaceticum]ARE89762.1 HTH-type transcriptional regulatory protein GabR [Clostridium formicaceticum]